MNMKLRHGEKEENTLLRYNRVSIKQWGGWGYHGILLCHVELCHIVIHCSTEPGSNTQLRPHLSSVWLVHQKDLTPDLDPGGLPLRAPPPGEASQRLVWVPKPVFRGLRAPWHQTSDFNNRSVYLVLFWINYNCNTHFCTHIYTCINLNRKYSILPDQFLYWFTYYFIVY